MAFEARSLKVQLPCKAITVIPAHEYDLRLEAHRYWRGVVTDLAYECGACSNCSNVTDRCPGVSERPGACDAGTGLFDLDIIDVAVLPIIRAQLEQKLSEIAEAEKAAAEAMGRG